MALNKAQIYQQARDITGNKVDRSPSETFIPDEAIDADLKPVVRELNGRYGTTSGLKEFIFTATPDQQDYVISTVIGADVDQINEVYRSENFVADNVFPTEPDIIYRDGQHVGEIVIPSGLQGDVFRTIVDIARAERHERYGWEIRGGKLRLFPPPVTAEVVAVEYTVKGFTIETLPDETESALIYAACTSILNGMLNRANTDKVTKAFYGENLVEQIRRLEKQRDYYETKAAGEINRLARG